VDDINLRHGVGCTACKDTGFKGQTGIYEFIEITPTMTDLILSQVSISRIRQLAGKQGYLPLFEAGLEKLVNGTICLEELLKETSNIEDFFGSQDSIDTSELHASRV
jgi:general secretion pathway protein E